VYSPANSEETLLNALARGEREATEQIYKRNYHVFNSWLTKNGGNPDDAADIFQEAMIVLFGKVQEAEFRLTCSLGTYLFAICKHLWYKRQQKSIKDPVKTSVDFSDEEHVFGPMFEEDIDVHKERENHFEQLGSALEQLGEPCRSLLTAFYHHDKTMAQISADFGYTNPENAKTQKYKCLARLKKLFYSVQAK
jgi:RNA polymerase sigma factor (sigma-70 family)